MNQSVANNNTAILIVGVIVAVIIVMILVRWWPKRNPSMKYKTSDKAVEDDDSTDNEKKSAGASAPAGNSSNWGKNLLMASIAFTVLVAVMVFLAVLSDDVHNFFKDIIDSVKLTLSNLVVGLMFIAGIMMYILAAKEEKKK